MMRVTAATLESRPGFIDLAREVEPLFGPMVDDPAFHDALETALAGNAVFVVASDDEPQALLGAVVVDYSGNSIAWLAVTGKCRGNGLGNMLLRHAMARLEPGRSIRVTTFAGDSGEAIPARKLYEKNGFIEVEPAGINPAGFAVAVMECKAP